MTFELPKFRQSRRDVLKKGVLAGTLAVGGSLVSTPVMAHPKPDDHELVWGDDLDYLAGGLRTYATMDPDGELSSLGVYMDADALAVFDQDPLDTHLHFPEVTTHQFTFLGFHYARQGHPPEGIYNVPHFDFHFYMLPEETVQEIVTQPATYSIPDAQIPTNYQRVPTVDTDDDGEPDTPIVEREMGEHLVDLGSPEFQEGGTFAHTMIYGAYDEDGDGTGHISFLEPMITLDFLRNLDSEVVVDMKTPDVYHVADEYPTRYVIEKGLHGGVYISLECFESFPGAEN